jgi:GNAT superfamily N-acetyltransferase
MSSGPEVRIRQSRRDELEWVNGCYAAVGFAPSDALRDTILIAEIGGQRAAIGRLVTIEEGVQELGGIYVLEPFRRYGVARELVEKLIELAGPARLYCIPFTHLSRFYESTGFVPIRSSDPAPPRSVMEKVKWCNAHYTGGVVLLVLPRR